MQHARDGRAAATGGRSRGRAAATGGRRWPQRADSRRAAGRQRREAATAADPRRDEPQRGEEDELRRAAPPLADRADEQGRHGRSERPDGRARAARTAPRQQRRRRPRRRRRRPRQPTSSSRGSHDRPRRAAATLRAACMATGRARTAATGRVDGGRRQRRAVPTARMKTAGSARWADDDAEQRSGRTALRDDVLLLLQKDEQGWRRLRRARRL